MQWYRNSTEEFETPEITQNSKRSYNSFSQQL